MDPIAPVPPTQTETLARIMHEVGCFDVHVWDAKAPGHSRPCEPRDHLNFARMLLERGVVVIDPFTMIVALHQATDLGQIPAAAIGKPFHTFWQEAAGRALLVLTLSPDPR